MSGVATLSVTEVLVGPDVPPGHQFLLSCPHGETGATVFGPDPGDEAVLALLRDNHQTQTGCGCAARVVRKAARA
jgi:hypothetical protein